MEESTKHEVSEATRNATTKCSKAFSCLNKDKSDLCAVDYSVNNAVYFLKCKKTVDCTYRQPFGTIHRCSCPTRIELYDKYKV